MAATSVNGSLELIEVSASPNFRENSEGGLKTFNASSDIQLVRGNTIKINKLIDILVNAYWKSGKTSQAENLGLVGVHVQIDSACLFSQI